VQYRGDLYGSACFDEENTGLWHEPGDHHRRLRAITRKTPSA
jgi:hypothetical protein